MKFYLLKKIIKLSMQQYSRQRKNAKYTKLNNHYNEFRVNPIRSTFP